jgi:hypothetical protein
MRILALDMSETSTGYAVWGEGDARAITGARPLGSEYTSTGRVFCNLHELMTEMHALGPIDAVFYERPRHLDGWNAQSNANAHLLLVGLAAHAESWGRCMECKRVSDVHMATWRRHFLGKMPRATKSAELKDLAMRRARELGFKPKVHDEAEAIGILDWACDQLQIVPYWNQVLRAPLVVGR